MLWYSTQVATDGHRVHAQAGRRHFIGWALVAIHSAFRARAGWLGGSASACVPDRILRVSPKKRMWREACGRERCRLRNQAAAQFDQMPHDRWAAVKVTRKPRTKNGAITPKKKKRFSRCNPVQSCHCRSSRWTDVTVSVWGDAPLQSDRLAHSLLLETFSSRVAFRNKQNRRRPKKKTGLSSERVR